MKNYKIVILLGIIFILSTLLYCYNNTSSTCNPNTYLSTINIAIQIFYNASYIVIAVFVLDVAVEQIKKTRESTNIQSLHNVLNRFNSKEMRKYRCNLAKYILNYEGDFENKISLLKSDIDSRFNKDKIKASYFKNIIESVIYEFEVLGYFKEKNIYELNDVYQLFSYEFQNYWLLAENIGYIDYLRGISNDFYDKFENLFKESISYEIYNVSDKYNDDDEKIKKNVKHKNKRS